MRSKSLALIVLSLSLFSISISVLANDFEVGLATVELSLPQGIPLAGYGSKHRRMPKFIDWRNKYPMSFFFRPSEGQLDPIRSKIMIIQKGDKKVLIGSIDVVGVSNRFVNGIYENIKKYGFAREDIFITATHTHAGPGTLTKVLPLAVIAVDLFVKENYQLVVRQTTEAIEEALSKVEEADLFTTSFQTEGVQKNKWRRDGQGYFDREAKFLIAKSKSSGNWLGGITHYAIHSDGLGSKNLKLSADFAGYIERGFEELFVEKNKKGCPRPSFLFLNGAEADIGTLYRSPSAHIELGNLFLEQSLESFNRLSPVRGKLKSKRAKVRLGMPALPLFMNSENTSNKLSRLRLGIPLLFKSKTFLTMIQIGDITLFSYPGEASFDVGRRLKKKMKKKGFSTPWIIGLANDYMSYFNTKKEYKEGKYDSSSNLFKWKGALKIQKAYQKMASGF